MGSLRYLLLPMLSSGLGLVQSSQSAVVALVETPGLEVEGDHVDGDHVKGGNCEVIISSILC